MTAPTRPVRSYTRELVHGTVSGYTYRGCRCELCLEANRGYRGTKPRAEYLAGLPEPQHGTESRYKNCDCRCDECRAASARARRARRKRAAA